MSREGGIERNGAPCGELRGGSVIHGGRDHPANAAVAMVMVVPAEELLAMSASIFDRAEAIREVRPVLQGLELRLGVRIVIRDVRAAMGLGDLQVDQERGDRLGSHAGAAISVQREGPGSDVFFLYGVGDELLGEFCGLTGGDQPPDNVAAVDVEDHVQMEAGPFRWTFQLRYVPAPYLIGSDRQQFRLRVGWIKALIAPLP